MRILLTGHNGYIGSIMTRVLKQAGHTVVGLDSYYYEDCVLGQAGSDITALRKDVRDVAPQDLKGFDAVVHLAALSNDPLGELNPDWTYDINYHASVKLAQAAKDAGVKLFLYSSSCSMYGAAGDDTLTEEAPLRPITHYAISKVRTEEDLAKLADKDFSPVFLRNSTAYGISPRLRADLVLNNLVGWAFTTGQVRIMSDGTPWRPVIHIEDLSLAAAAVLAAPREVIHAQAFNIGIDGENYQVRDLARFVQETVPNCRIEYAGQGGPDPRNYRVDFGKLRRLIPGFRPEWTAELGAKEIYEAFRRVKLTEDEFVGRKYTRVRQLKHLVSEGLVDEALRWKRKQP
jgi:nucleoside-diphosphate-sugar epimerase